jgi:BirA family biotin operon repressor/biotin-[acetyl-CoA-carboxylase] ligase
MSEPSLLTEHSVADAARAAGLPGVATFIQATGSTNSDLLRLAERDAPAWTTIVAGHQEAGRGRLGRAWTAPPGSSLLVSVLLRPAVEPSDAPLLTLAAGLAAADACREACGVDPACKWPNDLVVGERKLAGILAEARVANGRLEHAVVGLGMNVLQAAEDFPPPLRDTATSVSAEGGRGDLPGLLAAYLRLIRAATVELTAPGGPQAMLARYGERCATIGRSVLVEVGHGPPVEGRAAGVGDRGELVVETGDRLLAVRFGEVVHLR